MSLMQSPDETETAKVSNDNPTEISITSDKCIEISRITHPASDVYVSYSIRHNHDASFPCIGVEK